ncbi:NUDIX domain-containing protein [Lederbergia lenta]|uniref:MutT/NUDIX family protein n=1 Tax=Lederbergia lenta TaxID=1467 RepID=A0A2X4WG90_LEDLE|nr:NUDIX domain-containing protein [Lederbergia lenta]MCM3109607.1 NUDIX domain-containing protein [Lederbergia lenta]MEC2324638.1 NUDIX domain-containing protein [Lederbergia lenta]SQI58918.1 MutT/NUDIX family protein [Lederbergia lenta]
MTILINKSGHVFLDFLIVEENEIMNYVADAPLTHSLVVVKYQEKFLIMFNKWRKHWELAGGMIDEGETPRQCAVRELFEETNQRIDDIRFKGLMKLQLKPDDRMEYGALFIGDIKELRPFEENEETEQIIFWDQKTDIGYIDEIDEKLLEYY